MYLSCLRIQDVYDAIFTFQNSEKGNNNVMIKSNATIYRQQNVKKDNKYPLRINFTKESVHNALENEENPKDNNLYNELTEKKKGLTTNLDRNNSLNNNNKLFASEEREESNPKKPRKEIKISNDATLKKVNFAVNRNFLSFNKKVEGKKNNGTLQINNNNRLMITNNMNHNKMKSFDSQAVGTDSKNYKNYKISSHVVNEHIFNNLYEKEIEDEDSEDDILTVSLQSMNDSKMMEMANRYLTEEEILDKHEIFDILNSKKARY